MVLSLQRHKFRHSAYCNSIVDRNLILVAYSDISHSDVSDSSLASFFETVSNPHAIDERKRYVMTFVSFRVLLAASSSRLYFVSGRFRLARQLRTTIASVESAHGSFVISGIVSLVNTE